MKDQVKRWNQLAGTDKNQSNENKPQGILEQNLYGNQFMNQLLNEDLGEELAKSTEEKEQGEDESKEDVSDLGDEEKATLSNSELIKGLKAGAKDLAGKIPNMLNDEFAEIVNSVKEIMVSGDKAKVQKVIKYIEKLK